MRFFVIMSADISSLARQQSHFGRKPHWLLTTRPSLTTLLRFFIASGNFFYSKLRVKTIIATRRESLVVEVMMVDVSKSTRRYRKRMTATTCPESDFQVIEGNLWKISRLFRRDAAVLREKWISRMQRDLSVGVVIEKKQNWLTRVAVVLSRGILPSLIVVRISLWHSFAFHSR